MQNKSTIAINIAKMVIVYLIITKTVDLNLKCLVFISSHHVITCANGFGNRGGSSPKNEPGSSHFGILPFLEAGLISKYG